MLSHHQHSGRGSYNVPTKDALGQGPGCHSQIRSKCLTSSFSFSHPPKCWERKCFLISWHKNLWVLFCWGQTWKTWEHTQKENRRSLDSSLLSTTVRGTLPSTCKQLQPAELLDLQPASGTASGIKDPVKRTLIPQLREMTIRTEN